VIASFKERPLFFQSKQKEAHRRQKDLRGLTLFFTNSTKISNSFSYKLLEKMNTFPDS